MAFIGRAVPMNKFLNLIFDHSEDDIEANVQMICWVLLQRAAAEKLEAGLRELEIMRVELSASRQNVEKAEYDKAKVCLTQILL